MLNAELANLDVELQREINALPKTERVTKKGKLQLKNNLAILTEISEQLSDGDYLDAKLVQGKDVSEITIYKDGNVLKLGDKNGEEITIDEFEGGFTSGDIYRVELKPDPIEVKKLENQYSERKQDIIRLNIQKLEDDVQIQQADYVQFTVNSSWESMDVGLQQRLNNAFNDYIESDEQLMTEVSEMEEVEVLNLLDEFIKTNPIAAKIIEQYNKEQLDEATQRSIEENDAPEVTFEGETYDLSSMDISEIKALAKKLETQYNRLNKKPDSEKTNEEKEAALMAKFDFDLVNRYLIKAEQAEALSKEDTSAEEPTEEPVEEPVEEPEDEVIPEPVQSIEEINKDIKVKRDRAKKALARRVALLEVKRNKLATDSSNIKDTLKHLQELLDTSLELTGVQLEAAMGDADQIAEMIKTIVDFKYKNRPKTRIRKRDIKAQVEREFEFAKATLSRIAELKADLKTIEANKKDLTNQINYYKNMIADPNLNIFSKADIREKIGKLEKKLTTVEKLIAILKNAISKSVAYLKEYLNIWNSRYKTMTDFQKKTGFKVLSKDELGALIKSTNANSIAKADAYAGLKNQFDQLEKSVLDTIDDVELLEKVQDEERTRLGQLEAAADRYYDQIRYLYDLLDDIAEDITVKNKLEGATPKSPKAEATAETAEEFADITNETDKTPPVATYSFVDAEVADLDDIVGPPVTEEPTQEGIQVVTEINPELRSMLNQMGYKNKTIDVLPKSILERIVKEGIPSEEYGSRVITKSLAAQAAWATQGTPVTVKSIEKNGVTLQKVNGTETIFLTFDQLENSTVEKQKLPTMKPTQEVAEVTPEVKAVLTKGTDVASQYGAKDIDNIAETVKDSKLDSLEDDLFNLEICK
jgi:hypothetical protein